MNAPVWTIAGFDPQLCAGVFADERVFSAYGVNSHALITAISAQTTHEVGIVEAVSTDVLSEQILKLKSLGWPKVIKVGLIPTPEIVQCLLHHLQDFPGFVVYDPVIKATSGKELMLPNTVAALKAGWLQRVSVLTPNRDEAAVLCEMPINTQQEMQVAAYQLCALGVQQVIIKGGHLLGPFAQDIWCDGKSHCWITANRLKVPTLHGGGCVFSAALAAFLTKNSNVKDALVFAKMVIQQALSDQTPLKTIEYQSRFLPWITQTYEAGQQRFAFAALKNSLGFYTIINDIAWLKKLLTWQVSSFQLRIKSVQDKTQCYKKAIELTKNKDCQLFINDDWQSAIDLKAYGVHLGQEDLMNADLSAIREAGLRLGISTHSLSELAVAKAVQPSYIALGPIFQTTTKPMTFAPQGYEGLSLWRKLVDTELVAIGGITLQNVNSILAHGADSTAVVGAVLRASDPKAICQQFLTHFENKMG